MAIQRVAIPTPTAPVLATDYASQNDQLAAMVQAFTGRSIVDGSTIHAGAVMMIGGVLYKATSDTAISGTASNYVKITKSGDSLTATASFVSSLSGVSWNHVYGQYLDASGNLYLFDESVAVASGVITNPQTQLGLSAGSRKRTFTSSGTFVVPTGVAEVWVTGCAAGGNGGAGQVNNNPGSYPGGGGGGRGETVVKKSISVTPGESISITIGAVGSNTLVGSKLTLSHGLDGIGVSDSDGGLSGSYATYTTGSSAWSWLGGGGGASSRLGGGHGASGANGSSPGGAGGIGGGGGGGGAGGYNSSGASGGNGIGYGSGGGGGGSGWSGAGSGGLGGPAIIIVEW